MSSDLIVNNRFIITLALIITALSFLDNTVGSSLLYSYKDRSSSSTLIYLAIMYLVSTGVQFFLIFSIIKTSRLIKQLNQRFATVTHLLILASITLNALFFTSVVYNAFNEQRYELSSLAIFVIYNLSVSVAMIGVLVFRFALWLKRNRNLSILLYGIAFAVFFLAASSALISVLLELESRPHSVSPFPNPWDRSSTRHSAYPEVYRISFLVMFGLVWLATSIMLKYYNQNYTKGVGKKKYWLVVSLPLVYFLVSSDLILNQLSSYIFEYPYLTTLFVYLFGGTKQVGGIFFAIIFMMMSKYAYNKGLKTVLAFSAAGIMMLFSSLQISLLQLIPYPPFGLTTLSIMPISSYLLIIGLYYSARSIAFDRKILVSLRSRVKEDPSSFLSGIGSAEWSKNVEDTVEDLVNRSEESNQTDSELSPQDVQKYLSEVIEEIQRTKKQQ